MAWTFCITAKMPKRGLNGPVAQVADRAYVFFPVTKCYRKKILSWKMQTVNNLTLQFTQQNLKKYYWFFM